MDSEIVETNNTNVRVNSWAINPATKELNYVTKILKEGGTYIYEVLNLEGEERVLRYTTLITLEKYKQKLKELLFSKENAFITAQEKLKEFEEFCKNLPNIYGSTLRKELYVKYEDQINSITSLNDVVGINFFHKGELYYLWFDRKEKKFVRVTIGAYKEQVLTLHLLYSFDAEIDIRKNNILTGDMAIKKFLGK